MPHKSRKSCQSYTLSSHGHSNDPFIVPDTSKPHKYIYSTIILQSFS